MHLINRIQSGEIPLIESGRLSQLSIQRQLPDKAGEPSYFASLRQELALKVTISDGIAVVPVVGPIMHSPSIADIYYDGASDSTQLYNALESLSRNTDVTGVLLTINSPGGMVTGGFDIADATARISKKKAVVAAIDGMGASLAYLIASQATRIISTGSSVVGSIGVIASYVDYTKYLELIGVKMDVFTNKEGVLKASGALGTSLSDVQKSDIQERVDGVFARFKAAVLSKRPSVSAETMRGQVVYGSDAKKLGLIDAVGDQQYALSVLNRLRKTP